jgi:GNAT superfamily N-acetyltransferase
MEIRRATAADIDMLIQIRIEFIQDSNGVILNSEQEKAFRARFAEYIPAHIGRDFWASLAIEEGKAVSTVFLCVFEKPANLAFPDGREGTILNVYTQPEYRRQGLAMRLFKDIIEEVDRQKLLSCELIATEMGRPLYEKFGFKAIVEDTYMKRRKGL